MLRPLYAQGAPTEAQLIERAVSPYVTHERGRDMDEGVKFMGNSAEIWVLESLERGDLNAKLCRAGGWLFGGRLKRGRGAKEAFERVSSLQELSLIFYKVKTKVNPNLEGRYVQTRSAVITARFTLSRAQANMINTERAQQLLGELQCREHLKGLLDDLWVSPEVMKEREALERLNSARLNSARLGSPPSQRARP